MSILGLEREDAQGGGGAQREPSADAGPRASSEGIPRVGVRARRKEDGLTGVVYDVRLDQALIGVRWLENSECKTLVLSFELFARDWKVVEKRGIRIDRLGWVATVAITAVGVLIVIKACSPASSSPTLPTASGASGDAGTEHVANSQSVKDANDAWQHEEPKSLESCGALCPTAEWLSGGRGILRSETLSTQGASELVVTIRLADFTDDPVFATEIAMLDMDGVVTRELETGSEDLIFFHVVKETTQSNLPDDSGSTREIPVFDILYTRDSFRGIDVRSVPEAKLSDMGTVAMAYPLGATIGKSYCSYRGSSRFTPKFCSSFR